MSSWFCPLQLNEVERVRLALEESKQQSDASLTLLGSEITSLKENNAALLENLQELQEKVISFTPILVYTSTVDSHSVIS